MLGPRSSAVLSHLSKLATSTAHQTNINTGRADRKHQTRPKPTTTTRGQTKGQQTTHQTHTGSEAGRESQRTRDEGKTAGGGQQQQDKEGAREGSKDRREEAAQAKEKGACSSSGVLRGSGSLKDEYLSAGRKGTGTTHTTWCRGQSPTQGRNLCCREEKCRQVPSRHNTPCHRHDNRAVANTTRYPERGTSRTLTGPEGTSGLTEGRAGQGNEARRERAKPKHPIHQKQRRAKQPRKRQQQQPKANRSPATRRRHHKGSTQTKKHRTQRDNQSRPKQITGRKIRAPAHHPEKTTHKEDTKET